MELSRDTTAEEVAQGLVDNRLALRDGRRDLPEANAEAARLWTFASACGFQLRVQGLVGRKLREAGS